MTYAHVDKISEMYGIKIVKLNNGDVPTLVRKYGRFPSDAARFCTDELKIKVGKAFYKKLAQEQGQGFEVWYGMRKAESSQRENATLALFAMIFTHLIYLCRLNIHSI